MPFIRAPERAAQNKETAMDAATTAIELAPARWEQWLGAALRMPRAQALLAAVPQVPRPRVAGRRPVRTRSSLLWMLAITVVGFWML